MTHWLRPLLIIALALFAAPRVMAADGEMTVICAADGSRQVVLFDFETGTPVERSIVFETCDHCLAPPMAPGTEATPAPQRMDAADRSRASARPLATYLVAIAASARGPPTV